MAGSKIPGWILFRADLSFAGTSSENASLRKCSMPGYGSAIEYEPADVVSQPLIVQNKITNCIRQLLTLPLTFQATCLVPFPLHNSCPYSPYCIGGCAQLMCRNMRYCSSLSGGIGGLSCSAA
jgi:hypothetical protein